MSARTFLDDAVRNDEAEAALYVEIALKALAHQMDVGTSQSQRLAPFYAAAAAQKAGAPPHLIVAALLHDVYRVGALPSQIADEPAGRAGEHWVVDGFGPKVAGPLRLLAAMQARHPSPPTAQPAQSTTGGADSSSFLDDALVLSRFLDSVATIDHQLSTPESWIPALSEAAQAQLGDRRADLPALVYVGMSADLIHKGHLALLENAAKLGRVVVGLLTDRAIASYKRIPMFDFPHRRQIIEGLRNVYAVVEQDSLDYVENLSRFRPSYVVHGDDWRTGVQAETRRRVIHALQAWGGQLMEFPYTLGVSSTDLQAQAKARPPNPAERSAALSRALNLKPLVRIMEAHNGFSGLIVERARVRTATGSREFDGLWSGSLTTAAGKAKPDNGVVDFSARLAILMDILDASTKPVLFDAEDGGELDEVAAMTVSLERYGVSAIVLEDKTGPKRNSFADAADVQLAPIDLMIGRVQTAAHARRSPNMMIIVRLEGMVLGGSVEAAVERALRLETVGADLILPHSKHKDPSQIFAFSERYRAAGGSLPLMAIPTTYDNVSEDELIHHEFSIVVYANQLLRAAAGPMFKCALDVLERGSAAAVAESLTPIPRLLALDRLTVERDTTMK